MRITCKCGLPDCKGAVWFSDGRLFLTTDILVNAERNGKVLKEQELFPELNIYLDPNSLVELIREVKKELERRMNE